ncbi:hypothetical protein amrb99_41640 [Actinomadura sp. RB99]|nr:hypothetical protein [Actinomadura sp. RB99]
MPAAGRDASNTPTAQAAGATPGNTRAARKRDTAWATLSILDDIMPARHRHTQRPALTGPGTCCAKRAVAARRTDARSITRGAALHALPGCSEDWLGAADHVRRPSTGQAHSRHKPHPDSASAPSGGCRGALNLARGGPSLHRSGLRYMRCTAGGLQLHGSTPHVPFSFPARHWRLAARPALASPHPAMRAARALDSQHAGRQAMRGVRSLALAGTTPRVALHCLEALGRAWTPAELPAWRWSVWGVALERGRGGEGGSGRSGPLSFGVLTLRVGSPLCRGCRDLCGRGWRGVPAYGPMASLPGVLLSPGSPGGATLVGVCRY